MSVGHLNQAKIVENDEYYTYYDDIKIHLDRYTHLFKDKVIYCNCDNPEKSQFVRYFKDNFTSIGLKSLISSFYNPKGAYAEIYDGTDIIQEPLTTGDFRSKECKKYIDMCDIIISNPPFSIKEDYLRSIISNDKQSIFVCPKTAINNHYFTRMIMTNRLSVDSDAINHFYTPNGSDDTVGCLWFTTFEPIGRPRIESDIEYNPKIHPRYVNANAIDVSSLSNFPHDYRGMMGVPITFLRYEDVKDYHILGAGGLQKGWASLIGVRPLTKEEMKAVPKGSRQNNAVYLRDNGHISPMFSRIFIMKK